MVKKELEFLFLILLKLLTGLTTVINKNIFHFLNNLFIEEEIDINIAVIQKIWMEQIQILV